MSVLITEEQLSAAKLLRAASMTSRGRCWELDDSFPQMEQDAYIK